LTRLRGGAFAAAAFRPPRSNECRGILETDSRSESLPPPVCRVAAEAASRGLSGDVFDQHVDVLVGKVGEDLGALAD
jgi:hypothetical protein